MLVLTSTMAISQTSVWHGGKTIWTRGSGTEYDPFLIETADNLAFLAYVVNKGYSTSGMYFLLTIRAKRTMYMKTHDMIHTIT